MVYKMLVLNIDGTLLQSNGRVNKSTREAIEFAIQKDIKVVLATSRNFLSAKRLAKSLKIEEHIIAHQGSFIAKELEKAVFISRIPEKITAEIVTLLESFSCHVKIVDEKQTVGNKVKLPDNMIAKVVFQSANRLSYPEQYVDDLNEKLKDSPISPLNISVKFDHINDLQDAKAAFEKMYDEVDCIEKEELYMEIVSKGTSKLSGIKFLCSRYGVKLEEVVAIGSGLDDSEYVEWAGLGVAMKNAPYEIQQVADWITRTNDENGVAYMVKEHFRKQYKLEFLKKINLLE